MFKTRGCSLLESNINIVNIWYHERPMISYADQGHIEDVVIHKVNNRSGGWVKRKRVCIKDGKKGLSFASMLVRCNIKGN